MRCGRLLFTLRQKNICATNIIDRANTLLPSAWMRMCWWCTHQRKQRAHGSSAKYNNQKRMLWVLMEPQWRLTSKQYTAKCDEHFDVRFCDHVTVQVENRDNTRVLGRIFDLWMRRERFETHSLTRMSVAPRTPFASALFLDNHRKSQAENWMFSTSWRYVIVGGAFVFSTVKRQLLGDKFQFISSVSLRRQSFHGNTCAVVYIHAKRQYASQCAMFRCLVSPKYESIYSFPSPIWGWSWRWERSCVFYA